MSSRAGRFHFPGQSGSLRRPRSTDESDGVGDAGGERQQASLVDSGSDGPNETVGARAVREVRSDRKRSSSSRRASALDR